MTSQTLKEIKHQFMVFRNGIVADTLRNAGMPYHIIFGLQLPQLSQIAHTITPSMALAQELWEDKNVRESRLLACYLFPKEEVSQGLALELAHSVQTPEEADILCFRLLRYLPFADALAAELGDSDNSTVAYCSKALRRNLAAM
ncbi:MAG: DNA alkylation repair protein [Muribaculaceae bacterium]|nr:DNA alkylation repair protein [Muribaculaceae bacterium]